MAEGLNVNKSDIEIEDLDPVQDIVVFENVKDYYPSDENIQVFYCLGKEFVPTKKDWVGLFKCGWQTVQNYHSFQWAKKGPKMDGHRRRSVLFSACLFEGNEETERNYQFLYICKGDHVVGVSREFGVSRSPTCDYLGLDLLESMCDSPEPQVDKAHPLQYVFNSPKPTVDEQYFENMFNYPEPPVDENLENVYSSPEGQVVDQRIDKSDSFEVVNEPEISAPVKTRNGKERVLTVVKDTDSLAGDFSQQCWEKTLHVISVHPVVQEYVTNKERAVVPFNTTIPIFDISTDSKANMDAVKTFRVVTSPAIEYPTRLPITGPPVPALAVWTANVAYCHKCAVAKRLAARFKKEIQQIEAQLELSRAELDQLSQTITVSSLKKPSADQSTTAEKKSSQQHVFVQQINENKNMKKLQKSQFELRKELACSDRENKMLMCQKKRLTKQNELLKQEVTQLRDAAQQHDREAALELSLQLQSGPVSNKKGKLLNLGFSRDPDKDEFSGEWTVCQSKRKDRLLNTITEQEKIIAELSEKVEVHDKTSCSQGREINQLQKELEKEHAMCEKYQETIDVLGEKIRSLLHEKAKNMTNGWRQFARQLHNTETQCTPPTAENTPPDAKSAQPVSPRALPKSSSPTQTLEATSVPHQQPGRFMKSAVPKRTSRDTTVSNQPKSAGLPMGIVSDKNRIVAKIDSSVQAIIEKCPTCGIRFSSKAHRNAIEEHLAFHTRYD